MSNVKNKKFVYKSENRMKKMADVCERTREFFKNA